MTLQDLLKGPTGYNYKDDEYIGRMKPLTPRIHCMDGTTLSVQASEFTYCSPRLNYGPWSQVEVGFPSKHLPLLDPYQDGDGDPTDSVYGYVPIEIVEACIEACGGINLEWTILNDRRQTVEQV